MPPEDDAIVSVSSVFIPKIVTLPEIEKVTSKADFHVKLLQGLANGFVAFHQKDQKNFFAPPIQTLGAPPMAPFVPNCDNYAGQTCVKSGYFQNNPYYVIKVATGGHPLPNSGVMQVYAQATGRLLALLLDEGILTELRTAALSALVLRLWQQAKQQQRQKLQQPTTIINKIGIIGTGVQARYQIHALARETDCRHLVVYGRTPSNVEAYQKEMQSHGWTVETITTENPNDLLDCCEVVITTTPARTPLLTGISSSSKMTKGAAAAATTTTTTQLLICIGSDAPGKREVADTMLQQAVLRVADDAAQSRQRGEFQNWSTETDGTIWNLGEWIQEIQHANAPNLDGLVVFDSSGVALQDCVIAQMVYESL